MGTPNVVGKCQHGVGREDRSLRSVGRESMDEGGGRVEAGAGWSFGSGDFRKDDVGGCS